MRNRPKNWRTQKAKAKATWNTSTCAQLYVWMYRLIYIQIHICMWQAVRGRGEGKFSGQEGGFNPLSATAA